MYLPFGLVVRIPGFHPGGPGSIPGVGISFLLFCHLYGSGFCELHCTSLICVYACRSPAERQIDSGDVHPDPALGLSMC